MKQEGRTCAQPMWNGWSELSNSKSDKQFPLWYFNILWSLSSMQKLRLLIANDY